MRALGLGGAAGPGKGRPGLGPWARSWRPGPWGMGPGPGPWAKSNLRAKKSKKERKSKFSNLVRIFSRLCGEILDLLGGCL